MGEPAPSTGAAAAKHASLWLETATPSDFPALSEDVAVDVAVIGAGIVGVTAAVLLKRAGATVALVEAGRVGAGVTGHTTAKLTSLHSLTYAKLISSFGEVPARRYAEANQAAIERIARFVEEEGIECDFRRRTAYTYADEGGDLDPILAEVDAARRLGLPASFVEEPPLPFATAGAVRFEDQAEFQPTAYVRALAATIPGEGSHVVERSTATAVRDHPRRVDTDGGTVYAREVVVATHQPFLYRGLFFARTHPEREHVLALRLAGDPPEGMYLSTESPSHTFRAHPTRDGELLIVGGESHKTGQGGDTMERVRRLEAWARERFDVRAVVYRWAAQDNMPVDGLPFAGRLTRRSTDLWVATGLRKWGLTNGTAAAMILTDEILGRPNPWASVYDATRFTPLASATELLKENADVALRFLVGRAWGERDGLADLHRGEGRIVRLGGRQLAAYRDEEGVVHAVSPVCTHLRCIVAWNSAERTWDCPCHGSRFDVDGRVVQGPAIRDLERQVVDTG